MKQVRVGVFETNSSSVHSLSIMSQSNWERWKEEGIFFDINSDNFVVAQEEAEKLNSESYNNDYISFEGYKERAYNNDDSFERHYTTESGDKIVVFGYYGYDG